MRLRLTQRLSIAAIGALTPAVGQPALPPPVPGRHCAVAVSDRRHGLPMKTNRLELLARVRNRIAEEVLRRVMKHADRKALAGVIDPHEVSDAAVETIIASALGSARADYLPTSAAMRETLEKIDQV